MSLLAAILIVAGASVVDISAAALAVNASRSGRAVRKNLRGKSRAGDWDNWCMDGWKAETTSNPADPARSEWCKDSGSLACTPFSFTIQYQNEECAGGAPMTGVGPGAELSQRTWQADGDEYVWIFHTCDGSGVQSSDCNGANSWYVERVWPELTGDYLCHPWDDENADTEEKCEYGADVSKCQHNVCPHWHAGTGVTASKYQCGWWGEGQFKGDETPGWWEEEEQWNNQGYEYDLGDGWYGFIVHVYDWVCHSQAACDPADSKTGCKGWGPDGQSLDQEGDADKPYDWFPAGLNGAFSGDDELRCYCDNEPFGYDEEGKNKAAPGASLFQFKLYCENGDFDSCDPDTVYLMQIRGPGTCDNPEDCEQELHPVA